MRQYFITSSIICLVCCFLSCGSSTAEPVIDANVSDSLDGIYYRDSEDGSWAKLANTADQIASGDLDGDGLDDVIAYWENNGGIWVYYSSFEEWFKLSATPSTFTACDMNGDGKEDLLGSWLV